MIALKFGVIPDGFILHLLSKIEVWRVYYSPQTGFPFYAAYLVLSLNVSQSQNFDVCLDAPAVLLNRNVRI